MSPIKYGKYASAAPVARPGTALPTDDKLIHTPNLPISRRRALT